VKWAIRLLAAAFVACAGHSALIAQRADLQPWDEGGTTGARRRCHKRIVLDRSR
jgi:hypothetical protein